MKRLFAAIKILPDSEFLDGFRRLRGMLRGDQIKWVEEHTIHITLKFFGETEEALIPRIGERLGERASQSKLPALQLKGIGIFGSRYDPRVIWTGIEPFEPLARLMKEIQRDMVPVGFDMDRQNIVPHLTLGRIRMIRDKVSFQRVIDQFQTLKSKPEIAEEIILFESILRREGPEYIVLRKFPFQK
jgi:2'-5' RNA ligase